MPGVLVSFNDVVGARNEDNGFAKSWEIYKGEMVEGVGGGTCQVASTFHAAAFFGGLDIVERLPHSRPSAYIPMGLDATVVFPVVDMKLKNPYAFPVVVHAVSEGNKLHVEIRGQKKLAHVTFEREVKERLPFDRKIEEKAGISRARVIVKQHGVDGFKIERKRILAFADGHKREEKENDTYPADQRGVSGCARVRHVGVAAASGSHRRPRRDCNRSGHVTDDAADDPDAAARERARLQRGDARCTGSSSTDHRAAEPRADDYDQALRSTATIGACFWRVS